MNDSNGKLKERTLREANKLIPKYNVLKTAMDDIARACNKRRSTLYHHHKSKQSLGISSRCLTGLVISTHIMRDGYIPVYRLKIYISDVKDNSVNGARIIIDGSYRPGPRATVEQLTSSGDCQFLLGESISYFLGSEQNTVGNISATVIINYIK